MIADPYRFISRTCNQLGSDLFETRLLLEKTICMRGAEGAELFYESDHFTRRGAVPKVISKTLFGEGGIQSLDGEHHLQRRRIFLPLFKSEQIESLVERTQSELDLYARMWTTREYVNLYHELRKVLTEGVCAWGGIDLSADEVDQRTSDLAAMYEEAGSKGPGILRGRRARLNCEAWVRDQIEQIREGRRTVAASTAAHAFAMAEDVDGSPLPSQVAAVDLLSVLRPTVAVSVFIAQAAHALHTYPATRGPLVEGGEDAYYHFVQEVRRFYPFFPNTAAVVKETFEWKGYTFPAGTRVLLDLYGTNHHPELWSDPDEFRPQRFETEPITPYNLIAQGGGNGQTTHRCVGETLAIELMTMATRFIVERLSYDVPPQDLELNMSRLPALPRSGMVVSNVRLREGALLPHTRPVAAR